MTPEERRLVSSLVTVPAGPAPLAPEEFLRRFKATDGRSLGLELLRDATARRDGVDVEMAIIVCYKFGVGPEHLDVLMRLLPANWHVKHEDVVTALGRLRAPAAVDVLLQATQWVPEYLEYDECRNLARKAIKALAEIPGEPAEGALQQVLRSDDATVRGYAQTEIVRRGK